MREQDPLPERDQQRRVVQRSHAEVLQAVGAYQKVTVAMHQTDEVGLGGAAEDVEAALLERIGAGIVANPGLEQVTQDEDGVGSAVEQVLLEGRERRAVGASEVQVRQEVDEPPAIGGHDSGLSGLLGRGHERGPLGVRSSP